MNSLFVLGWWPCVWGGGLTLILFVGVSAVTKPPEDAGAFIGRVEKKLDKNNFRLWSGRSTTDKTISL